MHQSTQPTQTAQHEQASQPEKPAVNFYILSDSDTNNRYFFVCRLVEKALEQAPSVLILTTDAAQSQAIARMLWTATPSSFIAHDVLPNDGEPIVAPVVISHTLDAVVQAQFSPQVAVDLSVDATPLHYPKIMLVANQHTEVLSNSRMKYQSYVNEGITPTVHKISD